MSNFSLSGKIALLTGAAGFFGRYFAHALADAGAFVVLVDRNAKRLEAMRQERPTQFMVFPVDLYDRSAARGILEGITQRYALDILINNAFDFSI